MSRSSLTVILFMLGVATGAAVAGWLAIDVDDAVPPAITMPATSSSMSRTSGPAVGSTSDSSVEALFDRLDGLSTDGNGVTPGQALDALAGLTSRAPATAFARARMIANGHLREIALARVAAVWAVTDADAAFAALSRLTADDDSRRPFGSALFTTLASLDPETALRRILQADRADAGLANEALAIVAETDTDAVIAALEEGRDPDLRERLTIAAAHALAARDPAAATRLADSLPESISKNSIYADIGRQYAARDVEGALAWASGLANGRTPALLSSLCSTIAVNDLGRAVEMALEDGATQYDLRSLFFVSSTSLGYSFPPTAVTSNLDRMAAVVDRLIASDHSRAKAVIDYALEGWALADPDGAMAWLLGRTDVAPRHVAALAKGFWHGDVQMTAAAVDLLPPESRGEWISEVAAAYVQHDTDAALSWLSRYRGAPEYDAWISAAALSIASNSSFGFDAVAAARLLASAETVDPAAVTPIVQRWARQEPQAASDWALALRDPAARSAGAAAAAQAWAFNDVEAASRWALGLPSGDVRDAALGPILNRGVTDGSIDTRIVGAFSSAASREQALLAALPTLSGLARRDPDAARTLVRAHYTTPELQQSAQTILEGRQLPMR